MLTTSSVASPFAWLDDGRILPTATVSVAVSTLRWEGNGLSEVDVPVTSIAAGQGNPTGTISGHVTDPDGLAVPGATVTVASPVLQGQRTTTTSSNGDYIIPFLPAGEYELTFELQGFVTVKRQNVPVKMAETNTLDATLT